MRTQASFRVGVLAFGLLLVASAAMALPKSMAYRFYVDGQPVGRSEIRVTESGKDVRFDSKTRVDVGGNVIDLTCRTVANRKTWEVREFHMEGTKGGQPVAAHVEVLGDSVHGYVETGGDRRPKARKISPARVLLFEDWVMELEILIARTQEGSRRVSDTYGLVFAGSFLPADLTAGYTSEVLVEAGDRSMAARKLEIVIRGADPFFSHVDPVRGVPVYLQFPAVRAEAFLEEVFGENPATRFTAKAPAGK